MSEAFLYSSMTPDFFPPFSANLSFKVYIILYNCIKLWILHTLRSPLQIPKIVAVNTQEFQISCLNLSLLGGGIGTRTVPRSLGPLKYSSLSCFSVLIVCLLRHYSALLLPQWSPTRFVPYIIYVMLGLGLGISKCRGEVGGLHFSTVNQFYPGSTCHDAAPPFLCLLECIDSALYRS